MGVLYPRGDPVLVCVDTDHAHAQLPGPFRCRLCWSRRARVGTHQLGTRRAPITPQPRSAQTRQGRTARQDTNPRLGQRKNERTPPGGPQPRMNCAPLPSSPTARSGQGSTRSRPRRRRCIDDCRHRTLLVLLTPPVPGHTPWLVHRQRRGHEQQQQGDAGVKQRSGAAAVITGAKVLHEHQQDDGGQDVYQKCRQDPVVSEQAPRGAQ